MNNTIDMIRRLRDSFDLNDVEDYKSILMIVRSLFFEKECMERYELYKLVEEITNSFGKERPSIFDDIELYNYFIAQHISKDE